MNKKEWRPVSITEQAARRALAVGGVTDNATKQQVGFVTAAQHKLGHVTVFIRHPPTEDLAEIDARKAGLIILPTTDSLGLPTEATAEDLAIYRRVLGLSRV